DPCAWAGLRGVPKAGWHASPVALEEIVPRSNGRPGRSARPRCERAEVEVNVVGSETGVRLGFFIGVFLVMALGELFAPRRRLSLGKPARWASNLGLVVLNTLAVRILLPLGAVAVAV